MKGADDVSGMSVLVGQNGELSCTFASRYLAATSTRRSPMLSRSSHDARFASRRYQ